MAETMETESLGSTTSSDSDEELNLDALAQQLRAEFPEAAEAPPDPKPDKGSAQRVRRTKKPKSERNTSVPGSGRKKNLTADLTGTFGAVGIGLMAFSARSPAFAYDAKVILENGEKLAEALNELAQRNPAVYRALFYFINAGDTSKILLALAQIGIPIAANHKLIPVEIALGMGADPPPWYEESQRETQAQMNGNPLR